MRKEKVLAWVLSVLVVALVPLAVTFWWVQEGTFVALALALVGMIWYTYWTSQLARREDKAVVAVTLDYHPGARDVRVLMNNPTHQYAEAKLFIEPLVYGQAADLGEEYSGGIPWHMMPLVLCNGHFSIETPLAQFGKSFEQMASEANNQNYRRQLQLRMRVKWADEKGRTGGYPATVWFVDFRRNTLVYDVRASAAR